eukprot:872125_1
MNARSNRKPSQPKRDRYDAPESVKNTETITIPRHDELLLLSHCDGGNDIIHLETQPDSHEHIIGIVMLDYYNWFIDYIGWMELLWHHDSVCEWQERECKGHTAE